MRYRIVVKQNIRDLITAVNVAIKEGWEPLGAPFFTPHELAAQAMILRKSNGNV